MPGDARRLAASIIAQLKNTAPAPVFCAYGTQQRVLIGLGRESGLEITDTDNYDALWQNISQYIEDNADTYVFGFIGFDPANQLNKHVDDIHQKIDLFVPETVIECTPSGHSILKGNINISSTSEWQDDKHVDPIDINTFDLPAARARYADSVSEFIHAIREGNIVRATLARKIISPVNFELAGTFVADNSRHELSRSFYFSNAHIAFAGQCPELLAEGNIRSFETHKLSGTCSRANTMPIEELKTAFLADQRIVNEHRSSLTTIEDSLLELGPSEVVKFQVMVLPTLLHGWSKFVTRPDNSICIADCLRSIFPFGVKPVEQGFELIAQHENFCRGPYYGLVGCISPQGEFSFTQVIRSAFVDRANSYIIAGAAITQGSTAELEVAETCTKLTGIQVFERRQK